MGDFDRFKLDVLELDQRSKAVKVRRDPRANEPWVVTNLPRLRSSSTKT